MMNARADVERGAQMEGPIYGMWDGNTFVSTDPNEIAEINARAEMKRTGLDRYYRPQSGRYFEAFKQEPAGFASLSKWETHEGAEALAIGVVVGTADDGWMFSVRGGLLLSIPDLAILVTASAQLLDERPSMTEAGSAKLAAVLALLPAEQIGRAHV